MKCAACQTEKSVGDYAIKNGRQLASCNKCRDKAKIQRHVKNTEAQIKNTEVPIKNTEGPAKNTESPAENTEVPAKNTEVPAINTEATVENTEPASAASQPKFKWVWSKDFKVQRMVRVHEEYSHRSVPSIHKYNFHNALVDIADRFSPSLDKSISHLNTDYFHSSFY